MKHQHVLCVYPYRKSHIANGNIYIPPIGLEHIAASIEPLVQQVTVVDMRFEKDIKPFISEHTSLIAVCLNWDYEQEEVSRLINSFPSNILTVMGGREASRRPKYYLDKYRNLDIVIIGDGELIARDIVSGKPMEEISNIAFRINGDIRQKPFQFIDVVDNAIYPKRSLRRYSYELGYKWLKTGKHVDMITSSRGCPYNCVICTCNSNPDGTKRRWSGRSPESVVKELEEIKAKMIMFADVNFFDDRDRVMEICDLIIKRGVKKKLHVQVRLDIANHPEMIEKMEQAGIVSIMIGIESPHDRILKQMNKQQTQQEIRDAFKVLRRFNKMLLKGFYIVGNIGETEEEIKYISQFSKEIGLDVMALQRLRCPSNNIELKALVDATPGYYVGPDELVYSDRFTSEKLKEIMDWTNKDFFMGGGMGKMLSRVMKVVRIGYVDADVMWCLMKSGFYKVTGINANNRLS